MQFIPGFKVKLIDDTVSDVLDNAEIVRVWKYVPQKYSTQIGEFILTA